MIVHSKASSSFQVSPFRPVSKKMAKLWGQDICECDEDAQVITGESYVPWTIWSRKGWIQSHRLRGESCLGENA